MHPRDHLQTERRETSVMAHLATVADQVFGVIGELREPREPLAHPVERI
jgi:hypothetical protein